MRQSIAVISLGLYLAILLTACASTKQDSANLALAKAKSMAWIEQTIPPEHPRQFGLFSLRNNVLPQSGVLFIYIEGDGQVIVSGYPSDDPTPKNPVGLELALAQPGGAVAYLARPCQFTSLFANQACIPLVWTNQRYSEQVIDSMNNGIEVLKRETKARKIVLVGYSGGGTLSLLLAGRRSDVLGVVTVAGNLDIVAWANYHQLRPLKGSVNPADHLEKFQAISQIHFVGGRDEVVPPILTEDLAKRYPSNMKPKIISIKDNGHACCWAEQWQDLWKQVPKYQ